jgi:putative two-component system response regulator
MGSTYTLGLERLLQSRQDNPRADGRLLLARLQGEIRYRLSKGSSDSQFFIEAGRVLRKLRGTANAEARMQCLFDCASYFYGNAHGAAALELLQHLDILATRSGSEIWSRKVNTFLGVIFADSGNIAAAVPLYSKALDLARRLSDPFSETAVLINLGVALNYGGLYREAIPCLKRAVALAASSDADWNLRSPALTNLAQSYLHLGEFEEGLLTIRQSLAYGREPTDAISATSRAVREFTFVELALELGEIEEARAHALACLKYGRASGGARGQLLADIALAQCEIEGGNADAGLRALEQILHRCDANSVKTDVLVALIRAYDQLEQPEKSLSHLNSLISFVRKSREAGIEALLTSKALLPGSTVAAEERDLSSLCFREARLRAKVAERKALACQMEMLERFAVTADLRDDISGEHGYRVGSLAGLIAMDLGWETDATNALILGGRLHDVGKVGVPDRILLNSKTLEEIERRFITAHTEIGADLLGRSRTPHLRVAEEIARYHHEWWNGNGYPSKLAGSRIPIHARIVALADVFDALTHGRPYAAPWPTERALDEIRLRAGTQFDPELTNVFVALIARLHDQHGNLDGVLSRGASSTPFFQARERIREMLSAERMCIRGPAAQQSHELDR